MEYDVYLFQEIIESIPGILPLRQEKDEHGNKGMAYQGLQGQLVIVDISEEFVYEDEGKGYLLELGLGYLIPSMFPPPKPENAEGK